MDYYKLINALDGLFAFDSGAIDSGIHNEQLRKEVIEYLNNLSDKEYNFIISRFLRLVFLSEEALEKGYGYEDVIEFIKWLDNKMEQNLL